MNDISLIVVNIISLIMFIISLVMIMLGDSGLGLGVGIGFAVVWLIFTVVANYYVLVKSKQAKSRLEESNKKGLFNAQVRRINQQYESIISREDFFRNECGDDSSMMDLYEKIKEQMQSNIDSAEAYMASYDYVTRPEPIYLNNLCREGDALVTRFNRLVEQIVDVDTNLTSLDEHYVDDVIQCMDSMKQMKQKI